MPKCTVWMICGLLKTEFLIFPIKLNRAFRLEYSFQNSLSSCLIYVISGCILLSELSGTFWVFPTKLTHLWQLSASPFLEMFYMALYENYGISRSTGKKDKLKTFNDCENASVRMWTLRSPQIGTRWIKKCIAARRDEWDRVSKLCCIALCDARIRWPWRCISCDVVELRVYSLFLESSPADSSHLPTN